MGVRGLFKSPPEPATTRLSTGFRGFRGSCFPELRRSGVLLCGIRELLGRTRVVLRGSHTNARALEHLGGRNGVISKNYCTPGRLWSVRRPLEGRNELGGVEIYSKGIENHVPILTVIGKVPDLMLEKVVIVHLYGGVCRPLKRACLARVWHKPRSERCNAPNTPPYAW